jgi:hypothetical protein
MVGKFVQHLIIEIHDILSHHHFLLTEHVSAERQSCGSVLLQNDFILRRVQEHLSRSAVITSVVIIIKNKRKNDLKCNYVNATSPVLF